MSKKNQVQIPLSATLQTLKDEISKNPSVSELQQRIFFLGRELKSNHRSLSSLGIGKLEIFVLHLHYVKKTPAMLDSSQSGIKAKGINDKRKNNSGVDPDNKHRKPTNDVIELIDSSSRSPEQFNQLQSSNASSRRKRNHANVSSRSDPSAASETIELLDDDDDNGGSGGYSAAATNHRTKVKKSDVAPTTIDLS